MKTCEDCGQLVSHHGCTWCNEELYILDQYYELDMKVPDGSTEFMKKVDEQNIKLGRK